MNALCNRWKEWRNLHSFIRYKSWCRENFRFNQHAVYFSWKVAKLSFFNFQIWPVLFEFCPIRVSLHPHLLQLQFHCLDLLLQFAFTSLCLQSFINQVSILKRDDVKVFNNRVYWEDVFSTIFKSKKEYKTTKQVFRASFCDGCRLRRNF